MRAKKSRKKAQLLEGEQLEGGGGAEVEEEVEMLGEAEQRLQEVGEGEVVEGV